MAYYRFPQVRALLFILKLNLLFVCQLENVQVRWCVDTVKLVKSKRKLIMSKYFYHYKSN